MTQVSDPPCPARRYGYANRAGFGALRFQKGVCPHSSTVFLYLSSLHLNVRLYIRPQSSA